MSTHTDNVKELIRLCKQNYILLLATSLGLLLLLLNLYISKTRQLIINENIRNTDTLIESKKDELSTLNSQKNIKTRKIAHLIKRDHNALRKKKRDLKLLKYRTSYYIINSKAKTNLGFSSYVDYLDWLRTNARSLLSHYFSDKDKLAYDSDKYKLLDSHRVKLWIQKNHESALIAPTTKTLSKNEALIALRINYAIFKIDKKLKHRIEQIGHAIDSYTPLDIDANSIKDSEIRKQVLSIKDDLSEFNKEIATLTKQLIFLRNNRSSSEGESNQLKSEISQTFNVSGVTISASTLMPFFPIILIALYLMFLVTFVRLLSLMNESREKAKLQCFWFMLYRERLSSVFAKVTMFIPALFITIILIVSVYYNIRFKLQPEAIFSVSDLQFWSNISALICIFILIGIGIRVYYLRNRILAIPSIQINPIAKQPNNKKRY